MAGKIRWGVLGTGTIARQFAEDLAYSEYGTLQAAGSRSADKANTFARELKAAKAHGSYEKLVHDPEVDIVYVATPHPWHMEHTLLALKSGKPVLCEKPVSMSAAQLRRMIRAAKDGRLFLMDGMWTRFFPAVRQMCKWLSEERIGEILAVEADFGVHFQVPPKHRIHNPELGGGALLDLGIYVVSFASLVYGKQPKKIASIVHFEKTGVDDQSTLVFEYENGATATLLCNSRIYIRPEGRIYGTKGRITVHENLYRPNRVTLEIEGKNPETMTFPHPGLGLQFEADHVAECLHKGRLQSDIMPLDESLAIMRTMDKIRRQWKLKYPQE